ncbi:L-threonylcarbamoyladenylate synthase [bacterium]
MNELSETLIVGEDKIEKAVDVLRRGGVIGYPTETVYGLGGMAINTKVISRIQSIKGRQFHKPMLILVPDEQFISDLTDQEDIPDDVRLLMKHFWPGPLTLIFKAKNGLPKGLTSDDGGIGVRISSDPICQDLLERCRAPIISTSANPANQPPARTADDVRRYFKDHLDIILDGGVRNMNEPSTVIDVRSMPARLIRQGAIEVFLIKSTIGEIIVSENM